MDYIGIIHQRKIINGKLYRNYFVTGEGVEVGIPTGVTLTTTTGHHYVTNKLLAIRFPGIDMHYFAYKDRISQEKGLLRSIELVDKLTNGCNITALSTRRRKANNTNYNNIETPQGINLFLTNKNSIKLCVSYFNFSKLKFCTKNMSCGTVDNWMHDYPEKLQQAIKLRNESLELYKSITTDVNSN